MLSNVQRKCIHGDELNLAVNPRQQYSEVESETSEIDSEDEYLVVNNPESSDEEDAISTENAIIAHFLQILKSDVYNISLSSSFVSFQLAAEAQRININMVLQLLEGQFRAMELCETWFSELELQNTTENVEEEKVTMDKFNFYRRYGTPYFHDGRNFSAPENEDVIRKQQNGDDMTFVQPKNWTKSALCRLYKAVKVTAIEARVSAVVAKQEFYKEKVRSFSNEREDVIEMWEKSLEDCDSQIHGISLMKDLELFIDRYQEYDWEKISIIHFKSIKNAQQCRLIWRNYMHPSINKSPWTKIEDMQLRALNDGQNRKFCWEDIAKAMGTDRIAFQCFQRYRMLKVEAPCKWTLQEDQQLCRMVQRFRVGTYIPWPKITFYMGDRTKSQIYNRWTYSVNPAIRRGRFKPEEDALVLAGVKKYGADFGKIAKWVPGRTAVQIRDRYQAFLKEEGAKGPYTHEEDEIIAECIRQQGGKWSKVAKLLPHRTNASVRVRYSKLRRFMKVYPHLKIEDFPFYKPNPAHIPEIKRKKGGMQLRKRHANNEPGPGPSDPGDRRKSRNFVLARRQDVASKNRAIEVQEVDEADDVETIHKFQKTFNIRAGISRRGRKTNFTKLNKQIMDELKRFLGHETPVVPSLLTEPTRNRNATRPVVENPYNYMKYFADTLNFCGTIPTPTLQKKNAKNNNKMQYDMSLTYKPQARKKNLEAGLLPFLGELTAFRTLLMERNTMVKLTKDVQIENPPITDPQVIEKDEMLYQRFASLFFWPALMTSIDGSAIIMGETCFDVPTGKDDEKIETAKSDELSETVMNEVLSDAKTAIEEQEAPKPRRSIRKRKSPSLNHEICKPATKRTIKSFQPDFEFVDVKPVVRTYSKSPKVTKDTGNQIIDAQAIAKPGDQNNPTRNKLESVAGKGLLPTNSPILANKNDNTNILQPGNEKVTGKTTSTKRKSVTMKTPHIPKIEKSPPPKAKHSPIVGNVKPCPVKRSKKRVTFKIDEILTEKPDVPPKDVSPKPCPVKRSNKRVTFKLDEKPDVPPKDVSPKDVPPKKRQKLSQTTQKFVRSTRKK